MNNLHTGPLYVCRSIITSLILTSMLASNVAWANPSLHFSKDQETEEGLFEPDEILGREQYQEEKIKNLEALRDSFQPPETGLLKKISDAQATVDQVNAINEAKDQQGLQEVRANSERISSLIESYGGRYIKYGDGKVVRMFNGLVTDVENEVIYDKKENKSIRNMRDMTYNKDKQLISYQAETKDPLGNITKVNWSGATYWSEEDESRDARKQAGMLAAYQETRTDEIGVETTTDWSQLTYYTESDEKANDQHQEGQMSSFTKTEVSSATPDRVDTITTSDMEYLKREKVIETRSDDPKEAERRKTEDDKYETLMVGFHEERETFGVTTERDWRNAEYNDYNELTYYEEFSTTLGIQTDKIFTDATYDSLGRMTGFKETSESYGVKTIRVRSKITYNDQHQVLSYQDSIDELGVKTTVTMSNIVYNENGQMQSYLEITVNSEGFQRTLTRRGILYDTRGLITHYIDEYTEHGIHHVVVRSGIEYNENGFMVRYHESHREMADYTAPDGERILIDRITIVERLGTEYNANGLESAFQERVTDFLGLITTIQRSNIRYSGRNVIAYDETRHVHGTLSQSVLSVNNLDQFIKNGGDYVTTGETISYDYTIEKKFYGAKYNRGKLVSYTEEVVDSRKAGVTTVTTRNNQQYGSQGKVISYDETVATQSGMGANVMTREWRNGTYDAQGRLLSYSELTRTGAGSESLLEWSANLYNPISLIQSFTEIVIQNGHQVTRTREQIKYNNFDQMLFYTERLLDGTTGRETQKTWETSGYNSVGLMNDFTETTTNGAMTSVLRRHHLVYNSLGLLRQYVQELDEDALYTNAAGNAVVINRSSLLERIETFYNADGLELEYKEYRLDPIGIETRTHREEMTYDAFGNMISFLETSEIRSSFVNGQISGGQPPAANLSGGGTLDTSYTITRKRTDTRFDAYGNIQSYRDELTDSRKPGLTQILERENAQYSPTNQLLHYEENITRSDGTETWVDQVTWDAVYNALGLLMETSETRVDYLGTTYVSLFNALSFNAVDLTESSRETSYILDGGNEVAKSVLEKSLIEYNGLDQRVAYAENVLNGAGDLLRTNVWSGTYYDGSNSLSSRQTVTTEGSLTRTTRDLALVYDADGNVVDRLTRVTESAAAANDYQAGDVPALESDHSDAVSLNPAQMNPGTTLLDQSMNAAYGVDRYVRHQGLFNGLGLESTSTETVFQMNGASVQQTSQTFHQVLDQEIDGRVNHSMDTTQVSYTTSTGNVTYTVTKNVTVTDWDSDRGVPRSSTEILTDTRRSDGVGASLWSQQITRSNMAYDNENRLETYSELSQEMASDGSLNSWNQVNRSATQFDIYGRETSLTENSSTLYLGTDTSAGMEQLVTADRQWSGAYNDVGLLKGFNETTTRPAGGTAETTLSRQGILYDETGRLRMVQDTTTAPDGTQSSSSQFITAYDGASQQLLNSTTINQTTGLDVAEMVIHDQVQYDSSGQQTTYRDRTFDYGDYYVTNFAGDRGVLGASNTPILEVTRNQTTRNNKGQVIATQETRTDALGMVTTVDRSGITYSLRGQESAYHEVAETIGQIGGADALRFTVTKDFSLDQFNNLGLAAQTTEVLVDSRTPDLQSTAVRSFVYDANMMQSGFTQTVDVLDTTGVPPAYTTHSETVRSNITMDLGRMTGYTETLSQTGAVTLDGSGNWSSADQDLRTVQWTGAYITGTNRLNQTLEQSTQSGLTYTTAKTSVLYNHLGQELGYTTTATDPSGFAVTSVTDNIQYNAIGQQTSFDTESVSQGQLTESRRQDIQYNLNGQMIAYSETRHEQDSGVTVGINRVTILDRMAMTYNSFGQLTGYLETVFNPFAMSEILNVIPAYGGQDVLTLRSADVAPAHIRTATTRSAITYTPQNQLVSYHEDSVTTGSLTQDETTLADGYSATGPGAQESTGSTTVALSITESRDYQVQSFDSLGRETATELVNTRNYTDSGGNPHTLTTTTSRSGIVYDVNGRLYSYTEDLHLQDSDPAVYNKRTVTLRNDTQYTASGKVISLAETNQEFDTDAVSLLSLSHRIWTSSYHAGSDWVSSSIETITLSEADPTGIQNLTTTTVREGLRDASGNPTGIQYNERGQELSFSELVWQENGTLVSAPVLTRRIDQEYNALGKVTSYREEKGQLTTGFDKSVTSAYVQDAGGSWNSNGQYVLTGQVHWHTGQYDGEGRLLAYHQVTAPFGQDFTGLSAGADQSLYLYQAAEHIYFSDAQYNGLNQLVASTQTRWTYLDDAADGINIREDTLNQNTTFDALGRQTGSTEINRTRQDVIDYFTRSDKQIEYTGIRQTAMHQTIYTESVTNPGLPSSDPNAYSPVVTKRSYTDITYDALQRQASFTFTDEEGSHNPANAFVYIAGNINEQYGRSGITYDSRGRIDAYTDTYQFKDFVATTGANSLVVERLQTLYHDGVNITTDNGFLIDATRRGKVLYQKERVLQGTETQDREYSLEYKEKTGLLSAKNEYIHEWKLTSYTVDAFGRYTSYNGVRKVADGSGGEDLFQITKDVITYVSNDPNSSDFFKEAGFTGDISKDIGNDGSIDVAFNDFTLTDMVFESGALKAYQENFREDESADPADVLIKKTEIGPDTYQAEITKDGQTFFVVRELLADTVDGSGNPVSQVRDTYYTDDTFATQVDPATVRTYWFSQDDTTTPPKQLLSFTDEIAGTDTVTYTAEWIAGAIDNFLVEGTGDDSFTYERVRYYRWGQYKGQIRSFRIDDGLNTRVDNITYDMNEDPPVMSGYRVRQDGQPDKVYSQLDAAGGFTLEVSGQTYSSIRTSDYNGQNLTSTYTWNNNTYSNLSYDTSVDPAVITGFDLTTPSLKTFTNVTVANGAVTGFVTSENGQAYEYTNLVWENGNPLTYTRTNMATNESHAVSHYNQASPYAGKQASITVTDDLGNTTTYQFNAYSGNNLTSLSVTEGGTTTDYTFSDFQGGRYTSFTQDDGTTSVAIRNISYDGSGNIQGYEQRLPDGSTTFDGQTQVYQVIEMQGGQPVNVGVKVDYDYNFDTIGNNNPDTQTVKYEVKQTDAQGRPTEYWITTVDYTDFTTAPSSQYPRLIQMRFTNVTYDGSDRVTGYSATSYRKSDSDDFDVDGPFSSIVGDGGYSMSNIAYNDAAHPDQATDYDTNFNNQNFQFRNATFDAGGNLLSYTKNGQLWAIPDASAYDTHGGVTNWTHDGQNYENAAYDAFGGLISYEREIFPGFNITVNVDSDDRYQNQGIGNRPEFNIGNPMTPFNPVDSFDASLTATHPSVSMPQVSLDTATQDQLGSLTAQLGTLNQSQEPLNSLPVTARVEALTRYSHIEKEQLIHDSVTFASREVVTTEYLYNSYGVVTGIITTTTDASQEKVVSQTSRTDITVDRLGRTLTFKEVSLDRFGVERTTERLSTSYDEAGNVLAYSQRVTTRQILESGGTASATELVTVDGEAIAGEAVEGADVLGEADTDQVVEAIEVVTETVTNQVYNDKRQLLSLTKTTDLQRNGTLADGSQVSYNETITNQLTYTYDALGRLHSSQDITQSSQTPQKRVTTFKDNILYNERNQVVSYELSTREQVTDLAGNSLSDVTLSNSRLATTYDAFGRVSGYTEVQGSNTQSQTRVLERSNIGYGVGDRVTRYSERTSFSGTDYTTLLHRSNITYSRLGHELTWKSLLVEHDGSLGAERSLLTDRRNTVIDAFGNLTHSMERTLNLSGTTISPEVFFSGGNYPQGIVTDIIFEGGKYNDQGRYIGFRQTNASAYGNLTFGGKFHNISVVERVDQEADGAGRLTSFKENSWTSSAPDLLSTTSVSGITYNQFNQKTDESREQIQSGTFRNPTTGEEEQFYNRTQTELSQMTYNEVTGHRESSTTRQSTFTSPLSQNPALTTETVEYIVNQSDSGKALSVERNTKTETFDAKGQSTQSFTENTRSDYRYYGDFNLASEKASSQITEKGQVVANTVTETKLAYDGMNRVNEEMTRVDDHLQNDALDLEGQSSRYTITHKIMDHHQNGLVRNSLVSTTVWAKDTAQVVKGSLSVEKDIAYSSAGTRHSWSSVNYQISPDQLPALGVVANDQKQLEQLPVREMKLLHQEPGSMSLVNFSLIGAAHASEVGVLGSMELTTDQLRLSENLPDQALQSLRLMGMEPEGLHLQGSQKTTINDYDAQGRSTAEVTEGTTLVQSGEQPVAVWYRDARTNIERDSLGRIDSMTRTSSRTGQTDQTVIIRDRDYNAAGQMLREASAVQTGTDDQGHPAYMETNKDLITYDALGQINTYQNTQTSAEGFQTITERVNTEYDSQGRQTASNETRTFLDTQGQVVQKRSIQSEASEFNLDGQALNRRTVTTILEEGTNQGSVKSVEKITTERNDSYTYDNLGRVVQTNSQTTNGLGVQTVSKHQVLAMDEQGRVLEEETLTTEEGLTVEAASKARTTREHITGITYDDLNRRSAYESSSTDEEGKLNHSRTFAITYNKAGQRSGYQTQDFSDSYQANTHITTTSNVTYDALGRQQSFSKSGLDRDGHSFTEHRANMTYNGHNQMTGFESQGQNNGQAFNYSRNNIKYYAADAEDHKRGQIAGYEETGISSQGQKYQESHSEIKYDDQGRVVAKRVQGKRGRKAFDEDQVNEYYPDAAGEGLKILPTSDVDLNRANNAGRLMRTQTTSRTNSDRSETTEIQYDQHGNRISFSTRGENDGKSFNTTVSQKFSKQGLYFRATQKSESGKQDGKAFSKTQTRMDYNSRGQLISYRESGEASGKNYRKNVSQIKYNSLGQKTRTVFTDSRSTDFQSGGNTQVETYAYDSFGDLKETQLKTADYIVKFDANGNRKGKVRETASFQRWKEAEMAKARKAAEAKAKRRAKKRIAKELAKGEANSTKLVDANGNVIGTGGNVTMSQSQYQTMYAQMSRGFTQNMYPGFAAGITSAMPPSSYQALAMSVAAKVVPPAKKADLNAMVRRELSRIRITQPKLSQADVDKAVKNALKLLLPDGDGKKAISKFDTNLRKIKASGKLQIDANLRVKNMDGEAFATMADFRIEMGDLTELLDVLPEKDQMPMINVEGLFNSFGFAEGTVDYPVTVYTYDENGNAEASYEISRDTGGEGTVHTKIVMEKYDDNGYVTETMIKETYKGPNADITVDTVVNDDGSTESHVYGMIRNVGTGAYEQIDETRVSTTKAIAGGFISTTEVTDNLTGLQSTITDKYTGVKYKHGKMAEFTLEHKVEGQRMQFPPDHPAGIVVDILEVSTTKQYASKFDNLGRMVEYKQDLWSNSAPDKNTTIQVNVLAFDGQDRNLETLTQSWETGSSVDKEGNNITLNNYFLTHRQDIQYDSNDRVTSYSEKTYTQEPMADNAAANAPPVNPRLAGHSGLDPESMSNKIDQYESLTGEKLNPRTAAAKLANSGILISSSGGKMSSSGLTGGSTTLQIGSKSYTTTEGYSWKGTDTSRSGITYDYAGRTEWYLDAKGKAHRNSYDHLSLVKASQDAGVITKNIVYDGTGGNRLYWETKDTNGEQDVKGQHWAEYNTLGQVIWQADHLKSNGKKFKMHKITEKTFTYDQMGNQDVLDEKVLKDSYKAKTTIGRIISTVAAVVATVVTGGGASPWLAATIAGGGAFAGAIADGQGFGDALKQGITAAAMTYISAKFLQGAGKEFANSMNGMATTTYGVAVPLSATTMSQSAITMTVNAGLRYMAASTSVNTLANMAQGAEFGDALKSGAYAALGQFAGNYITNGLNDVFPKLFPNPEEIPHAFKPGSSQTAQVVEKLLIKYGAEEISERNDQLTSMMLTGVMNSVVSSTLNRLDPNVDTFNQPLNFEVESAILQGAMKGAYYQWLDDMQRDGKLSGNEAAILEGAGIEVINAIDFNYVREEINKLPPAKVVAESIRQSLMWADFGLYKVREVISAPLAGVIGDEEVMIKDVLDEEYWNSLPEDVREKISKVGFVHVNGLNNLYREVYDDVQQISEGASRDEIEKSGIRLPYTIIYNDSDVGDKYKVDPNTGFEIIPDGVDQSDGRGRGAVTDILQAGAEVGGFFMVDKTTKAIADHINYALTVGGKENIVITGHSHGGIKTSAALSGVYPWLRDKVKVVNYGSAHIKPYIGADEVRSIHREMDFVSGGVGMLPLRTYVFQPILNLFAGAKTYTKTIPLGDDVPVWVEAGPVSYKYSHSWNLPDKIEGNGDQEHDYSHYVPEEVHDMFYELHPEIKDLNNVKDEFFNYLNDNFKG